MHIGEKIKSLRTSKFMTQSELAGTEITRNMLSRIENGAAQPSLDTLKYIASKLNVSAGYLLADSRDEKMYKKYDDITAIKTSYLTGDYRICRDICMNSSSGDDEIQLILAQSTLEVAIEEFSRGKLHSAAEYLDMAIETCASTIYNTDHVLAKAAMYFRYMQQVSATISSNCIDEASAAVYAAYHDSFCLYAQNFIHIRETKNDRILHDMAVNNIYTAHIEAMEYMNRGEYRQAYENLHKILVSDVLIPEPMMYFVFCDLEICCREIENFKGAYEYSIDKIELLQKMLS